jgi:hypothetical protein
MNPLTIPNGRLNWARFLRIAEPTPSGFAEKRGKPVRVAPMESAFLESLRTQRVVPSETASNLLSDRVLQQPGREKIMTFKVAFKEIYIRLPENDSAFVCTIRYGGLPGKATRVPLEVGTAPEPEFKDETMSTVRNRSRFGPR